MSDIVTTQNGLRKGLGRVFIPDDRDKHFPLKAIMPKEKTDTHFKYWHPLGWKGDQGNTPQCVGYAWAHWLEDGGVTHNSVAPPIVPPTTIYRDAQKLDVWEGENYDGTSVRGGAKALMARGFISEYRWTWDIDELIDALFNIGPVVLGVDWYSNMSNPDLKNIIRPTGTYQGGHAIVLNGGNKKKELGRIKNSWGNAYGNNGHAYISFDDIYKLLNRHGEACIATEIKH